MQVIIDYDEGEVDEFIAAADAIEAAFPGVAVEGNPEGSNPSEAPFSVRLEDGTVIYQRDLGESPPTTDEIVNLIKKHADFPAAKAGVGCM
jgi:hypothetical protein